MQVVSRVAVAGAGTMGLGIAQACAAAGFAVILYDIHPTLVDKGLDAIYKNLSVAEEKNKISGDEKLEILARIKGTCDVEQLRADLVIEAVVEELEIKKKLFIVLEAINNSDCILTTNTSSLSINRIAEALNYRERFAGLHFFNPAPVMKLVEVIEGTQTSTAVTASLLHFVKTFDKTPVVVKDSPGFIVNRVARHYYLEALKLLEEGIADHEAIDKLLRSADFKMGPFELMDLIGIDINLAVTNSIYTAFKNEPRFCPSVIQQQKVNAGHLGKKSGKGFYPY
jgi:3-hydroxybutyryl-CoA dehydrogenase